MADRNHLLINAKLAEQMERYEEMAGFMKKLAETAPDSLTVEERNLLSVAYKNVVGSKRMAWRAVSAVEAKESSQLAVDYRKMIEVELGETCNEVKALVKDHLLSKIPDNTDNADDNEARVFFLKMIGDYCRYQAEVIEDNEEVKLESKAAYEKATEVATDKLLYSHPIRLGLALNYSVFFFEIMNDRSKACEIAEKASNQALNNPPDDEDQYKDSSLIHQLLRDNLSLWKQSEEEDDD